MIIKKIEFKEEERQGSLLRTWICDGFTIYEHPTWCDIKLNTRSLKNLHIMGNGELWLSVKKEETDQ